MKLKPCGCQLNEGGLPGNCSNCQQMLDLIARETLRWFLDKLTSPAMIANVPSGGEANTSGEVPDVPGPELTGLGSNIAADKEEMIMPGED